MVFPQHAPVFSTTFHHNEILETKLTLSRNSFHYQCDVSQFVSLHFSVYVLSLSKYKVYSRYLFSVKPEYLEHNKTQQVSVNKQVNRTVDLEELSHSRYLWELNIYRVVYSSRINYYSSNIYQLKQISQQQKN